MSEEYPCPSCDRVFDYDRVMKSHHARTHGESIAGIELTCEWCGSEFKKKSENIRAENNFCSDDCLSNWMSHRYRGEDNPIWVDGSGKNYGSNWYEHRRRALSSSDYQCELCGMGREEHQKEFGFDLEVHHRIRIGAFEDPEQGNYQDNLVVACRSCHRSKLEKHPIPHNDIRAP